MAASVLAEAEGLESWYIQISGDAAGIEKALHIRI